MLEVGRRIGLWLSTLAVCGGATAQAAFLRLAEGYTSRDERTGIVAAQRMFSVPDFPEVCASALLLDRLVTVGREPVRLVRGRWFSYAELIVVAVDAAGNILPPVPIAIDVEDATPDVLDLRSDMTADPDGKVLPINTGSFRFRIRAICEGHSASVVVEAEVAEP